MISKYKKTLQLSLAVVVGAGALALIIPEQASAADVSFVCYRNRTIGPISATAQTAYVTAGAFAGRCVVTP